MDAASGAPVRISMQLFSEPSYRLTDRPPLIDPTGTAALEDGRGFFRSVNLVTNANAGAGTRDAMIAAEQVNLHAPGGPLAPMGWLANGPNNSGPEPFTHRTAKVQGPLDAKLAAAWDELYEAASDPKLLKLASHDEAYRNVPGTANFWISTGDQMAGTTAREWTRKAWVLHSADLAPEARRLVEAAVKVNDLAIASHGEMDGMVAGRAAKFGKKLLDLVR